MYLTFISPVKYMYFTEIHVFHPNTIESFRIYLFMKKTYFDIDFVFVFSELNVLVFVFHEKIVLVFVFHEKIVYVFANLNTKVKIYIFKSFEFSWNTNTKYKSKN